MAGQGRLCQRLHRLRGHGSAPRFFCAWVLAHFVALPSLAQESNSLTDVRLRCEWTADEATFWNISLAVVDPESDQPLISEVENFSTSDQTTGAFDWDRRGSKVSFAPLTAMEGGAVQFRVRASPKAKLLVRVVTGKDTVASRADVPVKEFLLSEIAQAQSPIQSEQMEKDEKPLWTLSRLPGDELRVENLRPVPVYRPGDELNLALRSSALLRYASRSLVLQYSLLRIGDGETVSSRRWPLAVDPLGNSEPIVVDELAPELPGVYEIRCEIAADDQNIWSRLRRQDPPIVKVGRPFVVLPKSSEQPEEQTGDANWTSVGQVRPSESNWSVGKWLPKQTTRFIPGSNIQIAVGESELDLVSEEHAGETISLIPAGESFQATLPVLKPGFPHKVTIRYPASRATHLRVDVAPANDRKVAAVSFVLANEAAKVDEKVWETHTFVYYPSSDDQIWLTNLDSSAPVAFESIAVQAGPTHLDSTAGPTKKVASPARRALLRIDETNWVDALTTDLNDLDTLARCDPRTFALAKLWVAQHRLRDYVHAVGMSGVMLPANSGGLTCFDSEELFSRHDLDPKSGFHLATLLRLLEESELNVYVGIRPDMLLSDPQSAIRRQPAIAGTVTRGRHSGEQYNPLHSLVRESLASLVGELSRQCSQYKCFSGIAVYCNGQSHLRPLRNPSRHSGTLALFAESNHRSDGSAVEMQQPELQAWVGREMQRTYSQVARSCQQPLMLIMPPRDSVHHDPKSIHWSSWQGAIANGLFADSLEKGPHHVLAKKTQLQKQLAVATGRAQNPGGMTTTRAVSLNLRAPSIRSEPDTLRTDLVADVSRVIDEMDPSALLVDLPCSPLVLDDDFAELVRSFTQIPIEKMRRINPTDPASQTIHLRAGTKDNVAYVSMTSLVTWTSEVEFNTSVPIQWEIVGDLESGSDDDSRDSSGLEPQQESRDEVSTKTQSATPNESSSAIVSVGSRGDRARVTIPPGRMIVLRSRGPVAEAKIRSWSSRVSGGAEALEDIKRNVTSIVERIGTLSDFPNYGSLTNGGFEQAGGMGLVGWLHAQHPPKCVRVDDKECVEGERSVLLTTDPTAATRTWIVSEMFEAPRSGRLAVSLACRAELSPGDSSHRLRVSIEGTRDREPIRFVSEFEVPRNGQWRSREVVLEADGIDGAKVGSLRLTIDSLSGGRIWIDDIHLHDRFPTAEERGELQSQAFLAIQGLQKGNLTPSGRLLQNHWARHLLSSSPAPAPNRVIQAEEPPEETPGIADRIRSWLPRPLRF